ncbi:hypothetical protein C0Q70_07196 [Pomacea canaliculata]|uniref:Uncharacterized protein n=1 Tax=Pomacea canaliculata TaxID=400727 RepID=A0A2T7PEE5_POMCA|nr:hypothetical protein C0Q70_07196 [Pomacea canaliculata]
MSCLSKSFRVSSSCTQQRRCVAVSHLHPNQTGSCGHKHPRYFNPRQDGGGSGLFGGLSLAV